MPAAPIVRRVVMQASGISSVQVTDSNGRLMQAIRDSMFDNIFAYIGGDPNIDLENYRDHKGNTFLMAAIYTYKRTREDVPDPQIYKLIKLLLKMAPNQNLEVENVYGETPLLRASFMGLGDVVNRLLRYRADVNYVNKYGRFALGVACIMGFPKLVEYLLKHGADMNMCDIRNNSPLMMAAAAGKEKVVSHLLNRNPKCMVHHRNVDGNTAALLAIKKRKPKILVELMNFGKDVDLLYNEKGIRVFGEDGDDAVLINHGLTLAAVLDCPNIMKFLKESGIDLTQTNKNGKTAKEMVMLYRIHFQTRLNLSNHRPRRGQVVRSKLEIEIDRRDYTVKFLEDLEDEQRMAGVAELKWPKPHVEPDCFRPAKIDLSYIAGPSRCRSNPPYKNPNLHGCIVLNLIDLKQFEDQPETEEETVAQMYPKATVPRTVVAYGSDDDDDDDDDDNDEMDDDVNIFYESAHDSNQEWPELPSSFIHISELEHQNTLAGQALRQIAQQQASSTDDPFFSAGARAQRAQDLTDRLRAHASLWQIPQSSAERGPQSRTERGTQSRVESGSQSRIEQGTQSRAVRGPQPNQAPDDEDVELMWAIRESLGDRAN